jgi:hypothetical protein
MLLDLTPDLPQMQQPYSPSTTPKVLQLVGAVRASEISANFNESNILLGRTRGSYNYAYLATYYYIDDLSSNYYAFNTVRTILKKVNQIHRD